MSSWVTRLFDRNGQIKGFGSKKKSTNAKAKPAGKLVVTAKQQRGCQGTATQPFRAVTIYSRASCCAAAERIKGQKFIAQHAPQLPLGGCSQPANCHCRYKHLTDRREDARRDSDHGLPSRSITHSDRRNRRDRRRPSTQL